MIKNKNHEDFYRIFGITTVFAAIYLIGSFNLKNYYCPLISLPFTLPINLFVFINLVLFFIMAIATYLIKINAISGELKKDALATYWLLLMLSALCPYALKTNSSVFSIIWLIILVILAAMLTFKYFKLYKISGYILISYFLWMIYVTYINLVFYLTYK